VHYFMDDTRGPIVDQGRFGCKTCESIEAMRVFINRNYYFHFVLAVCAHYARDCMQYVNMEGLVPTG